MNELDFSGKQVLVVGGSSGIGNGIAQAFCAKGARVQVCGTRASASDYRRARVPISIGLYDAQLDVSKAQAIENFRPSFDRLYVLVLAQGTVIDRRRIRDARFSEGAGGRSDVPDGLRREVSRERRASQGLLIIVSRSPPDHSTRGRPGENASKTGARA